MKTEVYSWRVSPEIKSMLERESRRRKTPVSELLDLAVQNLLAAGGPNANDEDEQRQLRAAALKCVGAFAGKDPDRSSRARQSVRQRLRKRHEA